MDMSCILILYELSGQLHVCVSCVFVVCMCRNVQMKNTGLLLHLIYCIVATVVQKETFWKTLIEHYIWGF